MSKLKLSCVILMLLSVALYSQNTTSSIAGIVTDESGALEGATIKITHAPSGTVTWATSNSKGAYRIDGLRVGGPYTVEASFAFEATQTKHEIFLQLNETYIWNPDLKQVENTLQQAEITATASKFTGDKTGASDHITSKKITTIPTISRNLNSILNITPYANGNVFAGRDQRMNNYTVDGANFNYNMGLDGEVLPGGGNPISIDALEEVQVNIAPFDVRQSNFIGAGINMVTKGGTNTFTSSAYTFLKNENLRGNTIDGEPLGDRAPEGRNLYGITLGGPIIKNKLFFFVNGEYETSKYPIHKWQLSKDGQWDTEHMISRVTEKDMSDFSGALKEMYGYDTGSWTDFDGGRQLVRILARVDWNISTKHKFMLRYNYTSESKTNNPVGAALGINAAPVSKYSMTFRNSTWMQYNNVHSLTAELNSQFSKSINNVNQQLKINGMKAMAIFPRV